MTEHGYTILPGFFTEKELAFWRMVTEASHVWDDGRQQGGYQKTLYGEGICSPADVDLQKPFSVLPRECTAWDAYILHYPDGSWIDGHTDPVLSRHARLNVILTQCEKGGKVRVNINGWRTVKLGVGDGMVFRTDVVEHAVSRVVGDRYVLSCGVLF